jgi:DNA-binding MarR family transcriptional regulator
LQLEKFLPYRLHRIGAEVSVRFLSVYAHEFQSLHARDMKLTIPIWRVMATLGQFGELGAKAIGAHSYMHKTKVSRAVRALELRGWLRRRKNEEDRREEWLTLTPAGRRAYDRLVPRVLAMERSLIEALGPDARPVLAAIDRLESALELAGGGEQQPRKAAGTRSAGTKGAGR